MGVLLGSQAQSASRREWEAAQLWLKVEEDETWEASIQLNRTEVFWVQGWVWRQIS